MSADQTPQGQIQEKDLDKIPVKLTQVDLQFIAKQVQRRDAVKIVAEQVFADNVQHYVMVVAHKRNVQWKDEAFVGVRVEPESERAVILLRKEGL